MAGEEYLTQGTVTPSPLYNEQEKSPFKKLMGTNFVIFLVYYVIALAMLKSRTGFSNYAFYFIFIYPFHVIVNFIIGTVYSVKKDNERSSAYFLTAFLILIIGFGSCFLAVMGGI